MAGVPCSVYLFQIAKILPILTLASILEDPSKGSKETTYLPYLLRSTSIYFSSSSDTMIATLLEFTKDFTNTSFESTSNFFTSSPLVLD